MTHVRGIWLTVAFVLAGAPALAEEPHAELLDAATALCEKIKTCSMAQVPEADLTPEMRQMMEPMLDNMCASMRSNIQEVPEGHELHDPAVACMRSMAELSCEQMQSEEQAQTAACRKYEELVKSYEGG